MLQFKNFIVFYSNNEYSKFGPDILLYFVHCKIKDDKIDFNSDIGITFPGKYRNYLYFDLKVGVYIEKEEYKKKFKKLGLFSGSYYNYLTDNE